MMKYILCLVDLSPQSLRALEWSVAKALKSDLHLTILHAFRLTGRRDGENIFDQRKKVQEAAMRSFESVELTIPNLSKVSHDFKLEIGFVSDRVEAYANAHNICYLVIAKGIPLDHEESICNLLNRLKVPVIIV